MNRQASCHQLPSHGLTHSKFWVETDRKFIFFENTASGATQNNPRGPFQPLIGATLAGTLFVWEQESSKLTYLFTIENTFCLETQGIFFLCGTNIYLCTCQVDWDLQSGLPSLCNRHSPQQSIIACPGNTPYPTQRAVQIMPLLITLKWRPNRWTCFEPRPRADRRSA